MRSASAQGQDPVLRLFPPSGAVAGWSLTAEPRVYAGDQVFDYMDGAGELPRSGGLLEVGSAHYRGGSAVLEVAIFDMAASENAFGYYSVRSFLERSPHAKDRAIALDHPARLSESVGILTFWKGPYTVILQPDSGHPDDGTLLRFARLVSARIPQRGAPPGLLGLLPAAHRIAGSERYVRGKAAFDATVLFTPTDVFHLGSHPQVVAAEYGCGSTPLTLFAIAYPDGADASAAFLAFRGYLASRHDAVLGGPAGLSTMDLRLKGVACAVRSGRLWCVSGARDAAQALIVLHAAAK